MAGDVDAILNELGAIIGLPRLALGEGGDPCHLSFDGKIVVSISLDPTSDDLVLATPVGFATGSDTQVLVRLLDANFAGRGTRGATLARDAETGGIVLSLRLPVAGLRIATLERRLVDFVATAEGWTAHIAFPDADRSAVPGDFVMPEGAIRI